MAGTLTCRTRSALSNAHCVVDALSKCRQLTKATKPGAHQEVARGDAIVGKGVVRPAAHEADRLCAGQHARRALTPWML